MGAFKNIGIFSLGAVVGGVVMYRYLNNKLNDILTEELDAMKEFYEKDIKESDVFKKISDVAEEAGEAVKEAGKKFRSTLNKLDYNKMFVSDDENILDEPVDVAEMESPPEDKGEPEPPYIIDDDVETPEHYSKETLTYYVYANVLVDETEEMIEDPEYIVGREFLTLNYEDIAENYGGVVFVRNEKLSTDYEILLDLSDEETVRELLGYTESIDEEE